jgi:aminopeptidase N
MLWREYKYGKDDGDEHIFGNRQAYLSNPGNAKKDLVRFYYKDKEDVFDQVSYPKGGSILHMLRTFVGDSAFFKALNVYLTTHKFKAAEAHNLRLAFEEVSGRDLNWFFNQWYFGSGHPSLDINYNYDEATKKVSVIVKQTQPGDKLFKIPVAIDIYSGTNKVRNNIWVKNKVDTFYFDAEQKPDLVNFDGEKTLLCTKKENKSLDEYIYQYHFAGNFVDRREAVDFASKKQDDPKAVEFLKTALKDKYEGIRSFTLGRLDIKKEKVKQAVEPILADMAINDPKRTIRANAITKLGHYNNPQYASLFKSAINDSSYSVAGSALNALSEIDSTAALNEAKRLSAFPAKGDLEDAITSIIVASGDEASADMILSSFEKMGLSQRKFTLVQSICNFLAKSTNPATVKRGVDDIAQFREDIPEAFRSQTDGPINGMLKGLLQKKKDAGLTEQVEYIKSKLPEDEKKGF